MPNRRKQHVPVGEMTYALDRDTSVIVTAIAAMQPSYLNGIKVEKTALENSPNTTAPTSGVILAGDDNPLFVLSSVALYPVFTAATGAVSFKVWVKSGLDSADGPAWVPVKVVTFDGSTADVETRVDVGNRTVWIQALTGVDTKPVDLFVAVA